MKKRCAYCNTKSHNIATCDWVKIKVGDSYSKKKILERFGHINHRRWSSNGWEKVPVRIKLLDNKYECVEIKKTTSGRRFILESKRCLVKWSEYKDKKGDIKTIDSLIILLKS